MKKELFNKYRSRLVREGILKSLMYGAIGGLAAIFVASLVSWFFGFKGLWLAIGLGVGICAIISAVLYFAVFRPTEKEIARRVDGLGLDERIITMMELENDDSYIAKRQREDAHEKLAAVSHKDLKFRFAKKVLIWAATLVVLAPSMAVVSELAARDIIKSGQDIINPPAGPTYVEVTYVVEEGGEIDGEADQVILVGESATPVTAIAEEGWVFVEWDDGSGDPYRDGDKVNQDTVFTAVFEKIDNESGQDGQPGDGEGMPADGLPGEPRPGEGENNGPIDPNAPPGDGAGGDDSARNQVINGQTMYLPLLDDYAQDARDSAANDGNISDALRQIIDTYFDTLG